MSESILGEVGFHCAVLDTLGGTALLRLARARGLCGVEGGEDGAADGGFGGALSKPDFPLSDTLSDQHFDAWDSGDALLSRNLQELCLPRMIDHVHNQAAMQFA